MVNIINDETEALTIINSIFSDPIIIRSDIDFPKDSLSININTEPNPQWSSLPTINGKPTIEYLKPELATCKCCGAPLHGNRCEYCGSTYIWR